MRNRPFIKLLHSSLIPVYPPPSCYQFHSKVMHQIYCLKVSTFFFHLLLTQNWVENKTVLYMHFLIKIFESWERKWKSSIVEETLLSCITSNILVFHLKTEMFTISLLCIPFAFSPVFSQLQILFAYIWVVEHFSKQPSRSFL